MMWSHQPYSRRTSAQSSPVTPHPTDAAPIEQESAMLAAYNKGESVVLIGPPMAGSTNYLLQTFSLLVARFQQADTAALFLAPSFRKARLAHAQLNNEEVNLFVCRTRIEDDYARAATAKFTVGSIGRILDLIDRGCLRVEGIGVLCVDDVDIAVRSSRFLVLVEKLGRHCALLCTVAYRSNVEQVVALIQRYHPHRHLTMLTLEPRSPLSGRLTIAIRHRLMTYGESLASEQFIANLFLHGVLATRFSSFVVLAASVHVSDTIAQHLSELWSPVTVVGERRICRCRGLRIGVDNASHKTTIVMCDATMDEEIPFHLALTPPSVLIVDGLPREEERYWRRLGRVMPTDVVTVIHDTELQLAHVFFLGAGIRLEP